MENSNFDFNYCGFNTVDGNELTFDVCGKFIQVSLCENDEWRYFDLDLGQLMKLRDFIDNNLVKIRLSE
jgi:hypothetical protein